MNPRFLRTPLLPLALVALAATGCSVTSTGECTQNEDCAEGAICVEGLCEGGDVPIAAFTMNDTCALNDTVTIDGSASKKKNGSTVGLTYEWRVTPAGTSLNNRGTSKPTFVCALAHGVYKVRLTVFDQGTPSAAVEKTVAVINTKPSAKLKVVPAEVWGRGSSITLDATESSDPDEVDNLTFKFSVTRDPPSPTEIKPVVNSTNPRKATFTTGNVAATYTVSVTVDDGAPNGSNLSDTASLTRKIENRPPVANAGEDIAGVNHACVLVEGKKGCAALGTLTGTVSDPDSLSSDPVKASWKLKTAPPAIGAALLADPPTAQVSIDEPTKGTTGFSIVAESRLRIVGDYEFELTATDVDGSTATDLVKVTVANRAPTIVYARTAGNRNFPHTYDDGHFVGEIAAPVQISDPDGDDLVVTYLPIANPPADVTADMPVEAEDHLSAKWVVRVPGNKPGALIDPADPTKSIYTASATVADPNEGTAQADLAAVFTNQAPSVSGFVDTTTEAGHTYGTNPFWGSGNFYFGTFTFSAIQPTVMDPDGDPVTNVRWSATSATAPNLQVSFVPGDTASSLTRVILGATDQLGSGGTPTDVVVGKTADVKVTLSDPFGTNQVTRAFTVGNRPPVIGGQFNPGCFQAASTGTGCPSACGVTCRTAKSFTAARTPVLSVGAVSDPDGDPVAYAYESTGCVGTGCYNTGLVTLLGAPATATGNCTGSAGSLTCAHAGAVYQGSITCVGTASVGRTFLESNSMKVTVSDPFGGSANQTGTFIATTGLCPAIN